MLIITTVYLKHEETSNESQLTPPPDTHDIIEKKLLEETDPNRQLVIVYAGTNRVSPENK